MLCRSARGHGLLCDFEESLGLQHVVKRLVRGQNDVFSGSQSISVLCLFPEFRVRHQIRRSPKVSDELAETHSGSCMFEQARCIKSSGTNAAAYIGIDSGYRAVKIRKLSRARLAIDLMLRESQQTPNTNAGIILEGQLLSLSTGQAHDNTRRLCRVRRLSIDRRARLQRGLNRRICPRRVLRLVGQRNLARDSCDLRLRGGRQILPLPRFVGHLCPARRGQKRTEDYQRCAESESTDPLHRVTSDAGCVVLIRAFPSTGSLRSDVPVSRTPADKQPAR